MTEPDLAALYRAYIACLNAQDWDNLGCFVHDEAQHNGRPFGLAGYRAMLEQDSRAIPDLHFTIALLVVEPPHVAARLAFDCRPQGQFLSLPVNGRRIAFTENVFYAFRADLRGAAKIADVWSIIDTPAIAAQL